MNDALPIPPVSSRIQLLFTPNAASSLKYSVHSVMTLDTGPGRFHLILGGRAQKSTKKMKWTGISTLHPDLLTAAASTIATVTTIPTIHSPRGHPGALPLGSYLRRQSSPSRFDVTDTFSTSGRRPVLSPHRCTTAKKANTFGDLQLQSISCSYRYRPQRRSTSYSRRWISAACLNPW